MTGLWKRAIIICVFAVCVPIALSLPREKGYLRYIATTTFFFILFFDISMTVKGIRTIRSSGVNPTVVLYKFDLSMFSALAIYGLAFALPVVVLPVISPYNPDLHKRNVVSAAAILTCFILVLIPGLLGYLSFGAGTNPNVLNNFSDKDILIIIVRVTFCIVISFAYVAVNQSTMTAWSGIIFRDPQPNKLPLWKLAIVHLVCHSIPLLVAMFMANAKPALAIGGALGGCMADFFYPALMYIVHSPLPFLSVKKILCVLFAAFGLITTVISTYQSVMDAIKAFAQSK